MSMDFHRFLSNDRLIKILVVDDDEDNLLLVTYQLTQIINCSISTAKDGHSALTAAESVQPDLILLDIMLPKIDGFEVVRRLRQNARTQTIPVIAVTAMARTEDQECALQAGCNAYLSKPYELEHLAEAIASHLTVSEPTVSKPNDEEQVEGGRRGEDLLTIFRSGSSIMAPFSPA